MSVRVIKRTATVDGRREVILSALTPDDIAKIMKVPEGKTLEITMRRERDSEKNRLMWQLVSYVTANAPEGVDIRSKEELYDWLKLRVGYTKIVQVRGVEYRIPRQTNFTSCANQSEYDEQFFRPACEELANIMGHYDVSEMIEASIQWALIKNDAIVKGHGGGV